MSIDLVTLALYKSSLERTIVIESRNTEGVMVTVLLDDVGLEDLQPAKKRMLKTKPVSCFMLIALKRKVKNIKEGKWRIPDSNRSPPRCQRGALAK